MSGRGVPRQPVAGARKWGPWTDGEDAKLLEAPSARAAAPELGRTIRACETRLRTLRDRGLGSPANPSPTAWQPWELELVSAGATIDELVKATGRSRNAVRTKRNLVRRERFEASLRGER